MSEESEYLQNFILENQQYGDIMAPENVRNLLRRILAKTIQEQIDNDESVYSLTNREFLNAARENISNLKIIYSLDEYFKLVEELFQKPLTMKEKFQIALKTTGAEGFGSVIDSTPIMYLKYSYLGKNPDRLREVMQHELQHIADKIVGMSIEYAKQTHLKHIINKVFVGGNAVIQGLLLSILIDSYVFKDVMTSVIPEEIIDSQSFLFAIIAISGVLWTSSYLFNKNAFNSYLNEPAEIRARAEETSEYPL